MEAEFYGSLYSGTKYRYIEATFCVGGVKKYIKPKLYSRQPAQCLIIDLVSEPHAINDNSNVGL